MSGALATLPSLAGGLSDQVTDGALPIDYSEVTISRTMFRNGGSEYAINGTSCRLLDIQELLSDSGIGREMHVIVGQGQLDAVLRATPDARFVFVYLRLAPALLAERLVQRQGHFMKAAMLQSQLDTLEEPRTDEGDVCVVEITAGMARAAVIDAAEAQLRACLGAADGAAK